MQLNSKFNGLDCRSRQNARIYPVPRKVRQLIDALTEAGFYEIAGGKGSHRKLSHLRYRGAVTISGNLGDDARLYQEKQVRRAIEEVQE